MFDFKREYYTKMAVDNALEKVIHYLSAGGIYAPMMNRLSIKIDEHRSAMLIRMMDGNGASMCTDGETLAISTVNLHRLLNMAKAEYIDEHKGSYYTQDLEDEIKNILIHELTHAICKHSAQGLKIFNDRHQETHQKTLMKELACWEIACEIEANRGYGINKDYSPIYEVAVTEEKYPETKPAQYLLDIYQRVMDKYEDQVKEDMEAIKKALEDLQKSREEQRGNGSQTPNNDGQQGEKDEQGNSQSDGSGQASPNGQSKEANTAGDGSPNQNGTPSQDVSQSASNSTNGGGSQSQGGQDGTGEPLKLGPDPTTQSRREALKRILEEALAGENDAQGNGNDNPEMFNPDAECNHETIFNSRGAAYSHGGGEIDGDFDPTGMTPYEVLEAQFDAWQNENLRKALRKLKGTIAGKVSRNRIATYSRQARRDTSDGLLKKGHKRETRSAPRILLALDKSGSMSSTSTKRATEAVANIFETTGRPTEGCWICLHDGCVRQVEPMKRWKKVVAGFHPSGGNDFTAVIQLANKLDVDVVLNVGDGGDYTTRDRSIARAFNKAGRKWYDVSIVNIGRSASETRHHEIYWKDIYQHDAKNGGVKRNFIDLAGFTNIADDLEKIFQDNER